MAHIRGNIVVTDFVVTSAIELKNLAKEGKSVYTHSWRIKSAAWMLNMSFSLVERLINDRKIFYTINLTKLQRYDTKY